MAGELDNMKRLSRVEVTSIEIDPKRMIVRAQYAIVDEDGAPMYQHAVSEDFSGGKGQESGDLTFTGLKTWALEKAAKDASQRYGRKAK